MEVGPQTVDQMQPGAESNLQGHQVHFPTTPASAQYEQEARSMLTSPSSTSPSSTSPSSRISASTPFLSMYSVMALTEGKPQVATATATATATSPSSKPLRSDASAQGSPATQLQATSYSTRHGVVGNADGASTCEFSARKPTSPSEGGGDTGDRGDGDSATTSSTCSLSSTHRLLMSAVKGTIARVRSLLCCSPPLYPLDGPIHI